MQIYQASSPAPAPAPKGNKEQWSWKMKISEKKIQSSSHIFNSFLFLHFLSKQKVGWRCQKQRNPFTKKPRKAVWIRIAAHSSLTALKSLGGARSTVATAAEKASATGGESEHSEAALWFPLRPFHEDTKSPEELLHSFHFLLLPPTFS